MTKQKQQKKSSRNEKKTVSKITTTTPNNKGYMSKFINSNYKTAVCYGTTPQLVELRKDDNGNYHHESCLQRKKLPPKKNFNLQTLLDAKVDLKQVNTKIFHAKEIDLNPKPEKQHFTKKTEQTNLEVNHAE